MQFYDFIVFYLNFMVTLGLPPPPAIPLVQRYPVVSPLRCVPCSRVPRTEAFPQQGPTRSPTGMWEVQGNPILNLYPTSRQDDGQETNP